MHIIYSRYSEVIQLNLILETTLMVDRLAINWRPHADYPKSDFLSKPTCYGRPPVLKDHFLCLRGELPGNILLVSQVKIYAILAICYLI